jgi:hypothetical protein
MTIVAGIWSPARLPIPRELTSALAANLSRHPDDHPWTHDVPGCFLAKVDIGAFGEDAACADPDGSATVLAGEPLLDSADGRAWKSRTADTRRLHEAAVRGDWSAAQAAMGAYCAIHYSAGEHALRFATDLLGVRPLYECSIGDFVVVASAIRILEGLPGVTLTLDPRGTLERAYLQAPLAGRTEFREVRLLGAAEAVTWSADGRTSVQLHRWDRVDPGSFRSIDEAVDAVDAAFGRAVERRRRDDRATVAFLSGGLDSRVIVARLRDAGLAVRTLSFSLIGSLDNVIGRRFAEAAGCVHLAVPYHAGLHDRYQVMAADALGSAGAGEADRPRLVWAGFGGSAALGQINVWPDYVERCRSGDVAGAVESYLDRKGLHVPARLFREPFRAALAQVTRHGVLAEVSALSPADPGRLIELYLLRNSTRAQLHSDHEDTDRTRLEQHTPFFDVDFLRVALSVPYEWLARHHLYHRWIERLGAPVTSVPWQAYPGHEPCPLPLPADARPQWAIARSRTFRRRALLREAFRILQRPMPPGLIDRRYLASVSLLHALGARDYSYAITLAHKFVSAWERTGRRPVRPPEHPAGSGHGVYS